MSTFYTRYGKRVAVQLEFEFPSMTEQHHKDACDVNFIMRQYEERGVIPQLRSGGAFGDFSGTPSDFREACELVRDAQERFDTLPSSVRERFGNDPAALLDFLSDPSNRDEAEKLGLVSATDPGDAPDARAGASSVRVTGAAANPGAAETGASAENK